VTKSLVLKRRLALDLWFTHKVPIPVILIVGNSLSARYAPQRIPAKMRKVSGFLTSGIAGMATLPMRKQ
jgi:hypothetical protein